MENVYDVSNDDILIIRQALDLFARQNCCGGRNTRARQLIGVFKIPTKPEPHADDLVAGLEPEERYRGKMDRRKSVRRRMEKEEFDEAVDAIGNAVAAEVVSRKGVGGYQPIADGMLGNPPNTE